MALLKKSESTTKVPYTFEEDVQIMNLLGKGTSPKEVAKVVGRTLYSIRYRIAWLKSDKCPDTLEELKKMHKSKSKK